jgi:hypothetical protein
MLFVASSCGSSPSDVVAIEIDNSVAIETTIGSASTTETESTLAATTTTLATPDPSASAAPITQAPPIESPATQAPVTQAPTTQAPPAPSDPVGLRIEAEHVGGYERKLFRHWVDEDGDGCDTRREVLIAESLTSVQIGAGCSISGGRWFSIYDNVETTDDSSFHIDHVVALKEAWDSGAWNWNADQRKAFANDLDQPFFLIAVTGSSNSKKGADDPAEWMPPNASYHCEYVRIWIEIKRAWDLSVDQAEHDYLARKLASC